MKTAKIIEKEQSQACPYMTHYTLVYRGREYNKSLQGEEQNKFDVGDTVDILSTYRSKHNNLCLSLGNKIK